MTRPIPTRLFHITAIANLQAILQAGCLLSKTEVARQGLVYQNIAYQGAQGKRALKTVAVAPGGTVHDYVPFYFAPRSPMLMAINSGRVQGCDWRQDDIVHLETTVERVAAHSSAFVFYDRNATLDYSQPYNDLAHLDSAVAWDLLTEMPNASEDGFCRYWHNKHHVPRYADRMERRQAEFLVHQSVPLHVFTRIGVANAAKQALVSSQIADFGGQLRVYVMPAWYF